MTPKPTSKSLESRLDLPLNEVIINHMKSDLQHPFYKAKQKVMMRDRMQRRVQMTMDYGLYLTLSVVLIGLSAGLVWSVIHFIVKYW